jgi:hypothetical protein
MEVTRDRLALKRSTQQSALIGFDPILEVAGAQGVDGGGEGAVGGAGGGWHALERDRRVDRSGSVDDPPVSFCDPHSPWQRGSNENTNGLLRQYLPKRKPLPLDQAALDVVADELNGRPRQTLGWKTPSQALDQALLR